MKYLNIKNYKIRKLPFRGLGRGILVGLITAGMFSGALYVFALPYTPGETTNPTCGPTDTNCTVVPSAVYSFAANNFSGSGNFTTTGTGSFSSLTLTTTALDVGNGGTGLGTIATGSILAANSLNTLSAITSTSGTKYLTNIDGTVSWGSVDLSNYVTYTGGISIPTVSGQTGKYLTNDGSVLSWGSIDLSGYIPYSGATGAVDLNGQNLVNLGNTGIGTTTFGTSATKTLAIGSGTAPTTSPADAVQLYSGDINAGHASLYIRAEGTNVGVIGDNNVDTFSAVFGAWANDAIFTARSVNGATSARLKLQYVGNGAFTLQGDQGAERTTTATEISRIQGVTTAAWTNGNGGPVYIYGGNHGTGTVEGSVVIANADGTTKIAEFNESRAAFFGSTLPSAANTLTIGGNTGIGTSTFGTSATNTLALASGTAPSTSPADEVQLYAGDVNGAGDAGLNIRTESGGAYQFGGADTYLATSFHLSSSGLYLTLLDKNYLDIIAGSTNPAANSSLRLYRQAAGTGNWELKGVTQDTYWAAGPGTSKLVGASSGSGDAFAGGGILMYGGNHGGTGGTVEGSVTIANADGTTKIAEFNESKIGFFGVTPVVQQSGDIGTALVNLGLMSSATNATPTLTSTYVGYGDGSNLLTGDANFTWNSSTKRLRITNTGYAEISGSGAVADFTGGGVIYSSGQLALAVNSISLGSSIGGAGWIVNGTAPGGSYFKMLLGAGGNPYPFANWTVAIQQGGGMVIGDVTKDAPANAGWLRVTTGSLLDGYIGLGTTTAGFGTSATNTFSIGNGTAPSTSPADEVQLYVADGVQGGGEAGLFVRTEDAGLLGITPFNSGWGGGVVLQPNGNGNGRLYDKGDYFGSHFLWNSTTAFRIGRSPTESTYLDFYPDRWVLGGAVPGSNYQPATVGNSAIIGSQPYGTGAAGGSVLIYGGNHQASGTVEGSVTIMNSNGSTKMAEFNESKIGFFGATPVVQQSGDIGTALVNLGLMSSAVSLQDQINLTNQNVAYDRWVVQSHLGAGDQTWMQMFIDNMQDNTGMATSTGAYYNSASHLFSTVTPGEENIVQNDAILSFSSGEIPNAALTDNNEATSAYLSQSWTWFKLDFGTLATLDRFRIKMQYLANRNDWVIAASNDNTNWTTISTTTFISGSSVPEEVSFTQQAWRYWRWTPSSGYNGNDNAFFEIEAFGANTANVTLRTVTSTAAATPTHGSLFMVTKEVDSITPNTDVIGKIGKDGTTGMVTLTLSKIATIGVYAIYFGEADYTAGSGVTMQAEITTANTKAWELYGLTHSWR